MPLTMVEQELRPIARERIAKGQLPSEVPSHMWGGDGTGQVCSLCDMPIQRDEIEIEIDSKGPAGQTFRFHIVCRFVWQLECACPEHIRNRMANPGRSRRSGK